ncbi:type II toxin-antitoxin system VapB family antitoxin [Mesorhizobium sp. B2-1-8]|uniref:type II toxin-antitoxin system VapB family antitoxin n=1 Tax=unclassified Mesorhizobium TaxID=325217 RepID=UPI00112E9C19|nr:MULTISPECIES: type II toxin-antitoxin system VapB family antitoxin [unclassified Mesorhizobium]MBZ9669898.1 type II toxin-antitoxin system VapB family antitoxin [Mesorhizobium sp. ES1-3]TPI22336.1 histidinol dehydrogenase [Mesorhizobium sp. B3-2-1]UCI19978.1 type II toxin-antitoxin system VapB family antitoxin [Mesorhizobium sp. B2-1-8]
MPLYVKDREVDRLVLEVQRLTKAPSKAEAVRRALTHEIERARAVQSVSERLAEAVRMAGEIGEDNPDFDMKAYSDELSGGL